MNPAYSLDTTLLKRYLIVFKSAVFVATYPG